jgi:hypothetical protein
MNNHSITGIKKWTDIELKGTSGTFVSAETSLLISMQWHTMDKQLTGTTLVGIIGNASQHYTVMTSPFSIHGRRDITCRNQSITAKGTRRHLQARVALSRGGNPTMQTYQQDKPSAFLLQFHHILDFPTSLVCFHQNC